MNLIVFKENSPYASGEAGAGHNCAGCGWPIGHGQSVYKNHRQGERVYTHVMCPSLAQRRALRQQALTQG